MSSILTKLIASMRNELVIINWPSTLMFGTKWITRAALRGIVAAVLLVDVLAAVVVYGEPVTNIPTDPFLVIRHMIAIKIGIAVPMTLVFGFIGLMHGNGNTVYKEGTGAAGRTILVAGIRSTRESIGIMDRRD